MKLLNFLWYAECVNIFPWKDGPGGQVAKQFRYKIAPKTKVNCFKPKRYEGDMQPPTLRYSQFGGCFSDYQDMPRSTNVSVLWEVLWGAQGNKRHHIPERTNIIDEHDLTMNTTMCNIAVALAGEGL